MRQELPPEGSGARWNVVVVVADTLRTAYLGCYGNPWVRTPRTDLFAAESACFLAAHPESLPTIPMRRTLHTGRRAFPFREYRPVPWDNVYLPGWQPMSPEEGTLAEALARAGYHTGFVSDVPHYFVPGMNFTRGFAQWQFTRGQSEDRFGAVASADPMLLARYRAGAARIRAHIANVRPQQPEEEWPTPRTFRWAMQFLTQNAGSQPFFLYVDTFSPHETWECPRHYRDLYADPDANAPIWLQVPYGTLAQHPEVEAALPGIRAHYAGLVTMVDTWFGKLLDCIDLLGLGENTMVVFTSDHGTNFGDNAEGVIGKPSFGLYPGTMDIPLLIRHPRGAGAGSVRPEFVYPHDVTATISAVAGAEPAGGLDGQSLLPLLEGRPGFVERDYLTCRYGNHVWYTDARTWYFAGVDGSDPRLFDLEADPDCGENIASRAPERCALARQRILADAGSELRQYDRRQGTDALGRPLFEGREV